MKRSPLLFLALFATFACLGAPPHLTANTPPNIIFIFADDWGYGDLGIHGSTFCKTPHLDKMALEGTDFQNFTVASPVCSPSRTAVMTGHYPARHSIHQHFSSVRHHMRRDMPDWLDPDAHMMPRLLQSGGYTTAHFGKWHLSNRSVPDAPLPNQYGYDEYGAFNLPGSAPEELDKKSEIPRAIDFIKQNHENPFFINLWLHQTHTQHYPTPEYLEQFAHLENEKQRVYAATVAEADDLIGELFKTLEELGIDEKTLVIFSSDNGPESEQEGQGKEPRGSQWDPPGFGRHYSVGETGGLRGQKRSLFAGGIRVPFIARWPGTIPAGQVDRKSVMTAVDLLPTFADLAKVDLPDTYSPDGVSIVSALKGETFDRAKPIFWEWRAARVRGDNWPKYAVHDGEWKLFQSEDGSQNELYNIDTDWAQSSNVAAEFPEVVASLQAQLESWKASLPTEAPSHCFSAER